MKTLGSMRIRGYKVTVSFGKGRIRFSKPERINFEVVKEMLRPRNRMRRFVRVNS